MAFRDQLDNGAPFYNVTQAVGSIEVRIRNPPTEDGENVRWVGAGNRRDDVMLVQYLLRGILRKKSPQTAAKLAVDGFMGPITQGAINQFQLDLRNGGLPVAVDGRVDRARGPIGLATISFTIYTIIWLNVKFGEANPTVDFANIQRDPAMPALLRSALGPPRAVPVVTG